MSSNIIKRLPSASLVRWLRWIPVVIWANECLCSLEVVDGRSMQPTLNPNGSSWRDRAIFNRFLRYSVKRGDIITLRSPLDPNTNLIKRVIAVEGDTVQTLVPYPEETVVIPEGKIWVEGDERFHSEDSNHYGPVPLGLVRSKLAFVIWPPSRMGVVQDRAEHIQWRENRVQTVNPTV